MGLRYISIGFLIYAFFCSSSAAFDISDPLYTKQKVRISQTGNMLADGDGNCATGPAPNLLTLTEVIERALCTSPKTTEAWSRAKAQAAVLGVRRSEYLPSASASASISKLHNKTEIPTLPVLNQDTTATIKTYSLKMSYVLSDFGVRSSHIDEAQALLNAANAAHDMTLQEVFLSAAQSYYDTAAAKATLEAYMDAEQLAKENLAAATAKYRAGVGLLSDKLQAQTAYSQARLDRIRAEGDVKNNKGSLAILIGQPVNTAVDIAINSNNINNPPAAEPIDDLIAQAHEAHPMLLSLQYKVQAAKANIKAVSAEGLPTISLVSELNKSDQLGQAPSINIPIATNTYINTQSIGVQVSMPLFEGFGRNYKVKSLEAESEALQAQLNKSTQEIDLDIWKSYNQLQAESENIKANNELVDNASDSYKIAEGRYKAGVGTLLELLNAQTSLSNAKQQRIKSIAKWRAAKLKLAASIGKIGLWAIAEQEPK